MDVNDGGAPVPSRSSTTPVVSAESINGAGGDIDAMGNSDNGDGSNCESNDSRDGEDEQVEASGGSNAQDTTPTLDDACASSNEADASAAAAAAATAADVAVATSAAKARVQVAATTNTNNSQPGVWTVRERGYNVTVTPVPRWGELADNLGSVYDMEHGFMDNHSEKTRDSEDMDMLYGGLEGRYGDDEDDDEDDIDIDNATGLARAFQVHEDDDDIDPAHLPAALEFDPDAKPMSSQSHDQFRNVQWYSFIAAGLLILVVMSGLLTWQLSSSASSSHAVPAALSDRAVLGIREYVVTQVQLLLDATGRDEDAEQLLDDPIHPYSQALDWIQNVDTMALTPHSGTKFTQRFLAAYVYFATSVHGPWSNGCEPIATGIDDDSSCLYKFNLETLGVNVYTKTEGAKRWLSSSDECQWGGVTCDGAGSVVALKFSGSNMTGVFPEGIFGFPFLQYLTLSLGRLSGPLPSTLGAMKHLRRLELVGNQFAGPIPNRWYRSRSLQQIAVGNNNINGTISDQVGELRDMMALRLHNNDITGTIPSATADLKSLRFVWLNSNQLSGTTAASLMSRNLVELGLDRNKLTGNIPTEIGRATLCRYLHLQFNRLNSTIPTEISMLSNLVDLDVSDNSLTGSILPLANLTKIDLIRIENNQFSGVLPPELGRLQQMTQFRASGNNFVGAVPQRVCDLVAQRGTPNPDKILMELQLDCAVPDAPNGGGAAEISCPAGCCTQCCDANGMNCQNMVVD